MKKKSTAGRTGSTIFALALLFLLVGYILYPTARTVMQSFTDDVGYSWAGYVRYFSLAQNRTVICNTLLVGILGVVSCGAVGIFLAVYMRFFCRLHRRLIQILLLTPVMIPGVVIVIAFIQLYGESGMITKLLGLLPWVKDPPYTFDGLGGVVFVLAYTQYVYFYLNVYTALQYVDKNVVESVLGFGGGVVAVARDVVVPVIRPAVLISAMTTFLSAVSAYSAPSLIGNGLRVLSTQIVKAKANYNMPLASIQVTILLAVGTSVTALFYGLSRKYAWEVSPRTEYFQFVSRRRKWLGRVFGLLTGIQLVLVVLPVAAIAYLSFVSTKSIMTDIFPHLFTLENYLAIFHSPRVLEPMLNSIKMSALAVAIGLVLTLPTAYLGRRSPSPLLRAAEALLMLPWCVPASVIAINLINVFNVPNIFAFGKPLIGTFIILPIAYAIAALPLLLNAGCIALSGVSADTEEASRSLGAGPLGTFARIVLPTLTPGVLSGTILVFVRTMGEYTMSALLYGVYNRPISVSVVTNMQEYHVGVSLAYGALIVVLCCGLMWAILKLDRSRFAVE